MCADSQSIYLRPASINLKTIGEGHNFDHAARFIRHAGACRQSLPLDRAAVRWGAAVSVPQDPPALHGRAAGELEAAPITRRCQWVAALHPDAPDPGDVDTATPEWKRLGLDPEGWEWINPHQLPPYPPAPSRPPSFMDQLFALATMCIQQRLQESRPFTSPMMHFLAVMGIDEVANKLRRPQTYTRVLAGILYINRLLALEYAVPQQAWPTLDLLASAARADQLMHLKSIRGAWLTEASGSPTSKIFRQLAYGTGVIKAEGSTAVVNWSPDGQTLWFDGQPITLQPFRVCVDATVRETDLILADLMFDDRPTVELSAIRDSLSWEGTYNAAGYSFVNASNGFDKGFAYQLRRAIAAPDPLLSTNADGTLQYLKRPCLAFLQQERRFSVISIAHREPAPPPQDDPWKGPRPDQPGPVEIETGEEDHYEIERFLLEGLGTSTRSLRAAMPADLELASDQLHFKFYPDLREDHRSYVKLHGADPNQPDTRISRRQRCLLNSLRADETAIQPFRVVAQLDTIRRYAEESAQALSFVVRHVRGVWEADPAAASPCVVVTPSQQRRAMAPSIWHFSGRMGHFTPLDWNSSVPSAIFCYHGMAVNRPDFGWSHIRRDQGLIPSLLLLHTAFMATREEL
ncbi:MAG: hypothetical protein M1826_003013 [Phylliscum demangeonii]|nr:MAG: hypothetical protein M1826_003013 [Phylliscum demangeonii]